VLQAVRVPRQVHRQGRPSAGVSRCESGLRARVVLTPRAARAGVRVRVQVLRQGVRCTVHKGRWSCSCVRSGCELARFAREHVLGVNRALGSCLLLTLRRRADSPPPRAPAHSALARSHANFSASFSARWIGRPPSSSPTLSSCAASRLLSPSAAWRRAQSVRHP